MEMSTFCKVWWTVLKSVKGPNFPVNLHKKSFKGYLQDLHKGQRGLAKAYLNSSQCIKSSSCYYFLKIFQRAGIIPYDVHYHELPVPVYARYIRFYPTKLWYWNCMRAEVYGSESKLILVRHIIVNFIIYVAPSKLNA